MPTPDPANETREEFVSRCVLQVLEDGAAEDQDQAVAMCNAMWDRHDEESGEEATEPMDKHAEFLKAFHARDGVYEQFGYGISTAEPYVQALLQMEQAGCKTGRTASPEALLKEARTRLVCAWPEMVAEKWANDAAAMGVQGLEPPAGTLMLIRHVLTTDREDRDGDVLKTAGAELDPKAPLLWQHQPFLPIGKVVKTVEQTANKLTVVSALLDLNELTSDIAKLIEADALRFSHGFRVLDYMPRKDACGVETGGFEVSRFEVMEASLVSVPSNVDAEIELFSRGKLESEMMRAHAKACVDKRPAQVRGTDIGKSAPKNHKTVSTFGVKKVLSEFHPEHQHSYAAYPTHDWASQWLEIEVRHLHLCDTYVPQFAMGNFLMAMRALLLESKLRDTRNLNQHGADLPVSREHVQINSKLADTFIVDGFQFWEVPGGKCCIELQRKYDGMFVTRYDTDDRGATFLEDCWKWVDEHNYLRGEAIKLSGGFIKRHSQSLDDIFLISKNKSLLSRVINLVNGSKVFDSRGMIFLGPPGTGKTLSARAILSNTEATFIWATSKDIARVGIETAFRLAKDLAPAVVCFEDIESVYSDYCFDVLKTEMDGLDKSKGILTILTTNYPQMLPKSLIDRPGRFHDVMEFGLPDDKARLEMFERWTDSASKSVIDALVKQTAGFSGAHIHDLCYFAGVLKQDDELSIDAALEKAYSKVAEQRKLITSLGNDGRTYYRTAKHFAGEWKTTVLDAIKAGRVISSKNMDLLSEVMADLGELAGMDMGRPAKALAERCIGKLQTVIDSAKPAEEPEPKSVCLGHVEVTVQDLEPTITEIKQAIADQHIEITDVVNFVLGAADDELARVKHTLDLVFNLAAYQAAGEEYREIERTIDL